MKCPFFPFAVISVAYTFYILLVSAPLRVGAAHAPFQHITSAAPLSFRSLSLPLSCVESVAYFSVFLLLALLWKKAPSFLLYLFLRTPQRSFQRGSAASQRHRDRGLELEMNEDQQQRKEAI